MVTWKQSRPLARYCRDMRRGLVAIVAAAACGRSDAAPPPTDSLAIARAREWVAVRLRYCQAINHARDDDAECPTFCERAEHAEWDAYRSDCSGLVAWAWQLPNEHGGPTTPELA